MTRNQKKYNSEERFKNPNPEFYRIFQGQAKLNTGREADYYDNAYTKVTFEKPPANQKFRK